MAEQRRAELDALTDYYSADDRQQAAREQLDAAVTDKATAIASLRGLGKSFDEIAALCGLDEAQARALAREAAKTHPEPDE